MFMLIILFLQSATNRITEKTYSHRFGLINLYCNTNRVSFGCVQRGFRHYSCFIRKFDKIKNNPAACKVVLVKYHYLNIKRVVYHSSAEANIAVIHDCILSFGNRSLFFLKHDTYVSFFKNLRTSLL